MQQSSRHIVMLAAENDSLLNGKVGGLADVIRDLPVALAKEGCQVLVITPAYGFLHKDNPSKFISKVTFPFDGIDHEGEMWQVSPKETRAGVSHYVFEHPGIRGNPIYSQDPPGQPFAQDGTKFAIFCSATGQYIKQNHPSSIIHLHDWHMGFFLLLQRLHPGFSTLLRQKVVFTIHNLGYQGNRPIFGKQSSVERWFPELFEDKSWIDEWKDPRYKESQFTPLAAGIRFSHKINTVSPTYAVEILRPSDHEIGLYGGEGLEQFLNAAKNENRLFGIINGIEYPQNQPARKLSFKDLCELCIAEAKKQDLMQRNILIGELIVRLKKIKDTQPNILMTSVTRVTEQKARLLFEHDSNGASGIDGIQKKLREASGFYFLLGNGAEDYERKCEEAFKRNDRLIYLKMYSEPVARALYENGTIFSMPSSFEPCGISQMIAMRNGQPCIVHAVGGLKDTVIDGINGFHFSGKNIAKQVDGMVAAVGRAADVSVHDKASWEIIKSNASAARFIWDDSARKYIELLY